MYEAKKSILVVDDDEAIQQLVCTGLAKAGYEVLYSPNGPDAMYKVSQEHFDAIISDVQMPEMSGLDLMYVLNKLCEDTLTILLTATADPGQKLAKLAKSAGVFAYLTKPCKLDVIKETLERGFAEQKASQKAILSLDKLSEDKVCILENLIPDAIQNAISGIAGMVGREVAVTAAAPKQVPASDVAGLLRNPGDILVGINLDIQGDTTGHMLLIYPPNVAYGLADIISGDPLGTTIDLEEMGESALKEMGNVAGGFFLNSLADAANMRLLPSPPNLIIGEAGRILDNAFRPLTNGDAKVFVVQMTFETNETQVSGYFLALSTTEFINALTEHCHKTK
ncbi:MAG: response regulator [Planctomycetes bacterium]|nr:response regulator [Planctomycetota bacterium]